MDDYISRQAAIDAIHCDITITGRQNAEVVASTIGAFADRVKALPAADVAPVIRCKGCIHNNDCDIQYSAQAGENFFCGFGETKKDVREDVYE